jgi:hypothetical protein
MSKHLPAQKGEKRKGGVVFHAVKRGLFSGGMLAKILDMGGI